LDLSIGVKGCAVTLEPGGFWGAREREKKRERERERERERGERETAEENRP
jgi:hypothetical protein